MSLGDELTDLASRLAGAGWQTLFPDEWTPEQRAAYEAAPEEEKCAWVEYIIHEPIESAEIDAWTDPDGHLVHRVYEDRHHGNLVSRHDRPAVVNYDERRYGNLGLSSGERIAYLREHPELAMPSEREKFNLALPPVLETPDEWRDIAFKRGA